MANKRQLTGGTGDVNPQFLSASVLQTGTDSTNVFPLTTPIVRVGQDRSGTATIMEFLKVFFTLPEVKVDQGGAVSVSAAEISILTASPSPTTTVVPAGSSKVLCNARYTNKHAFTAAGTGLLGQTSMPHVIDLTDGAGHGVLVGTDVVFIQVATEGQTSAKPFEVKILYRFKTVALAEYIGIVQSQQGS